VTFRAVNRPDFIASELRSTPAPGRRSARNWSITSRCLAVSSTSRSALCGRTIAGAAGSSRALLGLIVGPLQLGACAVQLLGRHSDFAKPLRGFQLPLRFLHSLRQTRSAGHASAGQHIQEPIGCRGALLAPAGKKPLAVRLPLALWCPAGATRCRHSCHGPRTAIMAARIATRPPEAVSCRASPRALPYAP